MPRLTLALLGSFSVTLDGQPVTAFESDKARALLAYLAVESDRPHTREKLAGLLWPDSTEAAAHARLSHALANLRAILADHDPQAPVLLVTRQVIQFNREADALVDVLAFRQAVSQPMARHRPWSIVLLSVRLYHGRFLEGFSLPGCPEFEEWLLLEQEHLHRLAMETLARLADGYEAWGEFDRALPFAWRQLELDPWWESAHRQAMRLLARSGQRDAALAQYQTCCRLLSEELAAEPSPETVRLYEEIRDGTVDRPSRRGSTCRLPRCRATSPAGSPALPFPSLSPARPSWPGWSSAWPRRWPGAGKPPSSSAGRGGARRCSCTSSPGARWMPTPTCWWRWAPATPTRGWATPTCPSGGCWRC